MPTILVGAEFVAGLALAFWAGQGDEGLSASEAREDVGLSGNLGETVDEKSQPCSKCIEHGDLAQV
jgi:hypothetical protein